MAPTRTSEHGRKKARHLVKWNIWFIVANQWSQISNLSPQKHTHTSLINELTNLTSQMMKAKKGEYGVEVFFLICSK